MGKTILTRDQLYELVWTTPMTKLAQQYGLSDQGLAKKCKKHCVPRPPVGYWQKLEAGKSVTRIPLPAVDDPHLETIEIEAGSPVKPGASSPADVPADDPRVVTAKAYQLPEKIGRYHPLVQASRAAFSSKVADRYGFLIAQHRKGPLDLKITQQTLDRAHRLMHGLVTVFEKVGWNVKASDGDNNHDSATVVTIGDEALHIQLKEKVTQTQHVLTEKEKAEKARSRYAWHDKYDYIPTGVLSLKITNLYGQRVRTLWSDTRNTLLEQKLEAIVSGLIVAAQAHKRVRLEHEEQHRRWQEEERQREERRLQKAIEDKRTALLLECLDGWQQTEKGRRFITAVKAGLETGTLAPTPELNSWIHWIEGALERLSPLNRLDAIIAVHDRLGRAEHAWELSY